MATETKQHTLLKLQGTLPKASHADIITILTDRFGQPQLVDQHVFVFRKRTSTIQIHFSVQNTHENYELLSLSEYRPTRFPEVTSQQATLAHVLGNPINFFTSLGENPTHGWIEKGVMFENGQFTYKVVSIYDLKSTELDPMNFAVIFEGSVGKSDSVDQMGLAMRNDAKEFLGECIIYQPTAGDRPRNIH